MNKHTADAVIDELKIYLIKINILIVLFLYLFVVNVAKSNIEPFVVRIGSIKSARKRKRNGNLRNLILIYVT